jgi:isopenicillin-N N-acyltransferase-like protein
MKHKKRKGLRVLLKALLVIVILLSGLMIYFAVVAIDHPPAVNDTSALQQTRKDCGNNTFTFGNNWLRKSETGLWEIYIEGKPFDRGVAFGKLTRELLYYQETSFVEQIRELIPSDNYLKVLKYFIAFFNRNLDNNIPEEYKEEIYGTSFACSPAYNFIGSGYQRQLNYHAAHDIGHALQGLNLTGCTSFSVWDAKSKDSTLLIGRNFDFYMGDKFAENKIVCFMNPGKGYKFMMVTWADMHPNLKYQHRQQHLLPFWRGKYYSMPVPFRKHLRFQKKENYLSPNQYSLDRPLMASQQLLKNRLTSMTLFTRKQII